jgi:hypothetical protein
MIRDFHPGSRIRIQGSKRDRIPDPNPQHCLRYRYSNFDFDFQLNQYRYRNKNFVNVRDRNWRTILGHISTTEYRLLNQSRTYGRYRYRYGLQRQKTNSFFLYFRWYRYPYPVRSNKTQIIRNSFYISGLIKYKYFRVNEKLHVHCRSQSNEFNDTFES